MKNITAFLAIALLASCSCVRTVKYEAYGWDATGKYGIYQYKRADRSGCKIITPISQYDSLQKLKLLPKQ